MIEPVPFMTLGCAALGGVSIAAGAALRGWHGWLEIKRLELTQRPAQSAATGPGRFELADLKERVRRLEAIATGVDF